MLANEVTVQGEWTAEGTLELSERPVVPVGPVEVVIRPLGHGDKDNWWDALKRAREELERSGRTFRTKEEIDREIEDLRADREFLS
jgi:hypothetical protein